ncbi:MAG: calcium-binding protein, partial [Pseudodonghicola sp.]
SSVDLVSENVNEGFDTLHFGDGLTSDDLHMWTDSNGYLHIQSASDPQDHVRVVGSYVSGGTNVNQRIEQITFSDETAWDLTEGLILNDSDDSHSGIYGSAQGDVIHGNGGNDNIRGWDGDDTISGGTGSDYLSGGLGADTFVFFAEDVGTGSDTLWDFSLAEGDKIDLRDVLDAGYDPITDALADFVQFTNSGSNSIMSVDMDGTGTTYGWTQIATVYNHTNLDPDAMVTAGQLLVA